MNALRTSVGRKHDPSGNRALFVDPGGKGYTVSEGMYFSGIISKKVKRILKDRVMIIEDFENYSGPAVREFALFIHKTKD